jgi:hypothetical protein
MEEHNQHLLTVCLFIVGQCRLGMMWPGVEPYQGQYNQTYLNVMAQLISLFQMYNITVLLDAHQVLNHNPPLYMNPLSLSIKCLLLTLH